MTIVLFIYVGIIKRLRKKYVNDNVTVVSLVFQISYM